MVARPFGPDKPNMPNQARRAQGTQRHKLRPPCRLPPSFPNAAVLRPAASVKWAEKKTASVLNKRLKAHPDWAVPLAEVLRYLDVLAAKQTLQEPSPDERSDEQTRFPDADKRKTAAIKKVSEPDKYRVLRTGEAADYFGCKVRTINRWASNGKLKPGEKLGMIANNLRHHVISAHIRAHTSLVVKASILRGCRCNGDGVHHPGQRKSGRHQRGTLVETERLSNTFLPHRKPPSDSRRNTAVSRRQATRCSQSKSPRQVSR